MEAATPEVPTPIIHAPSGPQQATPAEDVRERSAADKGLVRYVVLQDEGSNRLQGVGIYDATDRDAAIKEAIDQAELGDGRYVAVPVRYFEPREVTVEKKTVANVTFG